MVVCPAACPLCVSIRIQTLVLRLVKERVIAMRAEPDTHFESWLRDATDGMRPPWNLRWVSKDFTDGDQLCGNPNCARADDGNVPNQFVLVCFSPRISLHVAQLVPLSA